jgi:PEP-CTERM motif
MDRLGESKFMKMNGARATLTLALLTSFASSGALADVTANKMTYLPLETNGGVLNPGVIVGFNPQPDPPGFPTLNLANPKEPILVQPAGPTTFDFVMSFSGLPGLLLPAVQKPTADGVTDFAFEYGDHTFDVTLTFSGPGAIRDWVSFNPQPDPPGVWFADAITFAATGDPSVSFSVSEDRSQLSFATPEPSTWALMGLGFAVLSVLVRRRAAQSPDALPCSRRRRA